MLCPVCGKFYFSELLEDEIEEGETPNTTQCRKCGWYYDLEQVADPDLENESNEMSLNQYKNWYKQKIKDNNNWEYYLDFIGDPEPHKCPVCGEYVFPNLNSYDICPVCGWEDDEVFDGGGANGISLEEAKENFAEKRKVNPLYKWKNEHK